MFAVREFFHTTRSHTENSFVKALSLSLFLFLRSYFHASQFAQLFLQTLQRQEKFSLKYTFFRGSKEQMMGRKILEPGETTVTITVLQDGKPDVKLTCPGTFMLTVFTLILTEFFAQISCLESGCRCTLILYRPITIPYPRSRCLSKLYSILL